MSKVDLENLDDYGIDELRDILEQVLEALLNKRANYAYAKGVKDAEGLANEKELNK